MFILKFAIAVANFIYMFFKLLPVKDKVVMISRQSNEVNSDFKLLGDVAHRSRGYSLLR